LKANDEARMAMLVEKLAMLRASIGGIGFAAGFAELRSLGGRKA
jgi:hypothetical protein